MRTTAFFLTVAILPATAFADNAPKWMDRQANPLEVEAHSRVEGYPATSHNLRARIMVPSPAQRAVPNLLPTPDGSMLYDAAKGSDK